MATVFISYGRQNRDRVRSLGQDLTELGHTTWHDDQLTGGQAWWDQILGRIRECDVFAYALSPESTDSQACKRELAYASSLGKSILPVLVAEGIADELMPEALAKLHYVDYRRDDKESLKALYKAFAKLPPSGPLPVPLPEAPPAPVSYLGGLKEQIEAPAPLPFELQTVLLLKLRHALADSKDREHVSVLMQRFRAREDLFARVADEIDALVASTGRPPVAEKRAADPPKPPRERTEERSREAGAPASRPGLAEPPAGTVSASPEPVAADAFSFPRVPPRLVVLSLVGGLVYTAIIELAVWNRPPEGLVWGYLWGSWSIPATVLLSVAFLYTKLAPRGDCLSLLSVVLVAVIPAYVVSTLMGYGGRNVMALELIPFGALVPAAVVAARVSSAVSTKSAAIMLLLASAIGGFLPLLQFALFGGFNRLQLLNEVLAAAFVVFLLASILRAKRDRELRQGRAP